MERPAIPKMTILPKPDPVEPGNEEVPLTRSIVTTKPSIASVASIEFSGERMI